MKPYKGPTILMTACAVLWRFLSAAHGGALYLAAAVFCTISPLGFALLLGRRP